MINWRARRAAWRNRVIANPAFQRWAAATPLVRSIAKSKAARLFDLLAGFTYSQVLLACVESGLLVLLARGPTGTAEIGLSTGLSPTASQRLLRAAAALGLAEEVAPDEWMLGSQGAVLHANPGAQAMIRHHRLLYADLADPLALLRADRSDSTALSTFWRYDAAARPEEAQHYSALMSASQAMVAEQVLAAYDFRRHRALLDVGGGHGRFAAAVAARHPQLATAVFDLAAVIRSAPPAELPGGRTLQRHSGDFFHNPLPGNYDCISLIRILHDHDDDKVAILLRAVREALPPEGTLVIAEPLADTRGAKAMGGAYFGFYLWAMGSGRPRTLAELSTLLREAGFTRIRSRPTSQPIVSSLLVVSH